MALKDQVIQITEEDGIHEKWYEEAREQTADTLGNFADKLLTSYNHNYGTICHACAALALAGAHAINADKNQGGITGFQAGAVMWEFIRHWNYRDSDAILRLIDYKDMLYPQHRDKFTTISQATWEKLQDEAKSALQASVDAHPNVQKHWENIANGEVPFGYKVEEERNDNT